jgi:hypothetical protein
MMEARSQDFRLDSSLRDACAEDIELVCGLEKVCGPVSTSALLGDAVLAGFKLKSIRGIYRNQ